MAVAARVGVDEGVGVGVAVATAVAVGVGFGEAVALTDGDGDGLATTALGELVGAIVGVAVTALVGSGLERPMIGATGVPEPEHDTTPTISNA